ncbi:MAG: GNAT family N-acetyltransferase [Deltaproteobacteria bacterium]|uniref:GNAT family N-acetyltransferase n=1 Tax=Candidatus Zymogenus saltonus TaxID=2844893 RepID=A0A9D8PQ73_9DELT|nr:GNAT family N-acetyltransferase [Candidatus Zymogenus saltonus]
MPKEQPEIATERLILRPFAPSDAPEVTLIVNDYEIASKTLKIPHPYKEAMAREWIATHREGYRNGELADFAVTLKADGRIIGAVGLEIVREHGRAGLGYWLGRDYWGAGYATEAAGAILDFGFNVLMLNRIHAERFTDNPASGRVIEKIGMKYEGHMREHDLRFGKYKDILVYGILKREY